MKDSLRTGLSFGVTSAIITTLGLMVGLHSGTHSRIAVLGGILTIAIADAFSDALGIHISEESENAHTTMEVWGSTVATFFSKFLFTLTFAIPVIFLPLPRAILASIVWGLTLLAALSYIIARTQRKPAWKIMGEHLLIGTAVIGMAHMVGTWVAGMGG